MTGRSMTMTDPNPDPTPASPISATSAGALPGRDNRGMDNRGMSNRRSLTSFERALVVLRKELRDHLRDRRSLVLALIYPLFGPLLIGALISLSSASLVVSVDQMPSVGVRNPYTATALIQHLKSRGMALYHVEGDPAEVIRGGAIPVVIEVLTADGTPAAPQVAAKPEDAKPEKVRVRVVSDPTRLSTKAAAVTVTEAIRDWNRRLGEQSLRARGIDAAVLNQIEIEQINIGQRANVALFFYNLIPPLTIFMIFLGGVYLAIDTTVGERERGSWEPLLTAPAHRWELLAGKAMAAFIFTALSVAINLAMFRIALGVAVSSVRGLEPPPEVAVMVAIFVIALPLMTLAVMLQISIAAITRSMKEAQIYLGLLPLVPALPSMLTAFSPLPPGSLTASLPVVGQMMLFGRLTVGEPILLHHVLLASTTTLVLAALVFRWAAYLFDREKLYFPN